MHGLGWTERTASVLEQRKNCILRQELLTTMLLPIRASSTINNNPFAISSGSTTVTVTDTGHGAVAGDFVTFSGTASTGDSALTAAVLNAEYIIDSVTDANTYVITATAASASVSGSKGGASVVAAYQINVGLNTVVFGTGWGVDTYGAEGYGSASTGGSAASGQLRIWSLTNYGEDLLANVRNGGIFTWGRHERTYHKSC